MVDGMWDKFVNSKAEAKTERRGRKKGGYDAHFVKLKYCKGYVVYNICISRRVETVKGEKHE
jgi:hypothetical protein